MGQFLIYGASGYTGSLCAEHAVERGLRPIVAGRSRAKVQPLAERLGLDARAFPLDDPARLAEGIAGVAAVLHAAGPFSATARPMAETCLQAGIHYLDITGEIDVFEAMAGFDGRAKAAGVMLLPGAGFDVVPSDCLAAHLKARMPQAVRLRLSIGGLGSVSRGTAKTMAEGVGSGTRVRRSGRIVALASPPRGIADFGNGPRPTVALSWGDVATAWHSTGIPDIEMFFQASPALTRAAAMPALVRRLLASGPAQRFIARTIERRLPPGPTPEQRARGRSLFLGEAWDAAGTRIATRMETAEGYTLTAQTAVEIARRAASEEAVAGFQTPATAFGADFVLRFERASRTDL